MLTRRRIGHNPWADARGTMDMADRSMLDLNISIGQEALRRVFRDTELVTEEDFCTPPARSLAAGEAWRTLTRWWRLHLPRVPGDAETSRRDRAWRGSKVRRARPQRSGN